MITNLAQAREMTQILAVEFGITSPIVEHNRKASRSFYRFGRIELDKYEFGAAMFYPTEHVLVHEFAHHLVRQTGLNVGLYRGGEEDPTSRQGI